MKLLITGIAGFIGFHLANQLIEKSLCTEIIGVDNINDYYDISIKYGRLNELGINPENITENSQIISQKYSNLSFYKTNLEDFVYLDSIFEKHNITHVCNLAAQAGVRYSLINPFAYINSNIVGFTNILELSRKYNIQHLVYASSSSVYGLNKKIPFSIHDNVDHPISLYAASKKSNELMAHTYSYLFKIPTTGLRFFTVYGPWGRPDLALFKFTQAIMNGEPIEVYNNGLMMRDFTYVSDIVEALIRIIQKPASSNLDWTGKNPDPATSIAPYRIYNIGRNQPVKLLDFIELIEKILGKKSQKILLPMQPGDVESTWADVHDLNADFDFVPQMNLEKGINNFIRWYKDFYK